MLCFRDKIILWSNKYMNKMRKSKQFKYCMVWFHSKYEEQFKYCMVWFHTKYEGRQWFEMHIPNLKRFEQYIIYV